MATQALAFGTTGRNWVNMFTRSLEGVKYLYYTFNDNTSVYTKYNYSTSSWLDTSAKTIYIVSAQDVSADFYTWFTSNTTKTSQTTHIETPLTCGV